MNKHVYTCTCRLNQLTWLIPADEIWLKLGGDNQREYHFNPTKPKSVENSCLFKAPDSVFNIHLALDPVLLLFL